MCNWFNIDNEDLWFKGLKYAEAEFKACKTYQDGLVSLERDLYYVGFSQQPFCQGVRDYYKHVKSNPLTFSRVSEHFVFSIVLGGEDDEA